METMIGKGNNGWKATTQIDLDAPYVIEISTHKSLGVLVTNATRYKLESGMKSYMMFGDFSKRIIVTKNRCTEKSVLAQHAAAIADVDAIKAECAAFYAARSEANRG